LLVVHAERLAEVAADVDGRVVADAGAQRDQQWLVGARRRTVGAGELDVRAVDRKSVV
jgi:hypothetical protein